MHRVAPAVLIIVLAGCLDGTSMGAGDHPFFGDGDAYQIDRFVLIDTAAVAAAFDEGGPVTIPTPFDDTIVLQDHTPDGSLLRSHGPNGTQAIALSRPTALHVTVYYDDTYIFGIESAGREDPSIHLVSAYMQANGTYWHPW